MGIVIKVFRYPSEYRHKVAQVVEHYYTHRIKIIHYARHTVVLVYPDYSEAMEVIDRRNVEKFSRLRK